MTPAEACGVERQFDQMCVHGRPVSQGDVFRMHEAPIERWLIRLSILGRDARLRTVELSSVDIERTTNGEAAPIEHVGVDHGGLHVLVSEELLDGADVVAAF